MIDANKTLDALLVVSYRTGDKKALTLLFKRWNKKICLQAYRYTNDWESAKDITQDTWRTVIAKIHVLKDVNSFGSWVMTIASRKALDSIKRDKKFIQNRSEVYATSEIEETNDIDSRERKINRVLGALTELPLDQRMVLKLFYLEEYSLKEISKITGVTVNTVKTRLFRAREKMKTLIKK